MANLTSSQAFAGKTLVLTIATVLAIATPAAANSRGDRLTDETADLLSLIQPSLAPITPVTMDPTDVAALTDPVGSNLPATSTRRSLNQPDPVAVEPNPPTSAPQPATPQLEVISDPNDQPDSTQSKPDADSSPSAPTSEEIARENKLIEADALYKAGQIAEAEVLYRQAKDPFSAKDTVHQLPEPILDPALLAPGGQVFWRESEAGLAQQLQSRILVPLTLLVDQYPEFVPGHLRLADELRKDNQPGAALAVMEQAAMSYPNQPSLQKGLIAQQVQSKRWLEASITARQFTLLNPEHPDAPEFSDLSDQYQQHFRAVLRDELTNNIIGGVLGGAIGLGLTGNPFSTLPTVQTSILLLRGESSIGTSFTKRYKKKQKLIEDPEVQAYVDGIGQKLAAISGRDLDYEFYVVKSEKLNAFAVPGGKVFINAGAILKSNSEAELAGLMAHELSHTVLSHGFQLVTRANATAGMVGLIPYAGGLMSTLAAREYSRDMEQQSDLLGTRMLASAGYAADGLRNLMEIIDAEKKATPFPWLSTHPVTKARISYLEAVIERNGYNRYGYEGITAHKQIKARVQDLLAEQDQQGVDAAVEQDQGIHNPETVPPEPETPAQEQPQQPQMESDTPDLQ